MSGAELAHEAEVEDALEIEVVDDTPEEDRHRPAPTKEVERVAEKDDDEELASYSENVQKRMKRLKWEYHEERRAKEAAKREQEEAIRVAQKLADDNKRLAELLSNGEQALVQQAKKRAETEMAAAKAEYQQAYEVGDTAKMIEAQERMTRLTVETRDYERWRPSVRVPETPVVRRPEAPEPDERAKQWGAENPWFNTPGNEEMTALAMGLHEKLVKSGVDPRSEEYFEKIDTTMRKRFPDYFEAEEGRSAPPKKPATVVAPAQRSVKAPRKVQLTATQVALAKRLGITPERYAAQLLKDMDND